MRRSTAMIIALTALAAGGIAEAQQPMRDRLRARLAERAAADRATGGTQYSYGADPLQRLKLWKPATNKAAAPLIVFIHGGGWKQGSAETATGAAKVTHFTQAGYALASIDYRLVPAATVEQQAADVAAAIAYLRREAKPLGIDASRIVLMGHSAGAHLAALIGTDPQYLQAAGMSLSQLRGVVALDGAAYDVPRQIAEGNRVMQGTYAQAFGTDPARQRALSPTLQAAAPNAPSFLILHVQREDGIAQSQALGAALKAAGTAASVASIAGQGLRGHMEINRSLGQAEYPATAIVDRWLAGILK